MDDIAANFRFKTFDDTSIIKTQVLDRHKREMRVDKLRKVDHFITSYDDRVAFVTYYAER